MNIPLLPAKSEDTGRPEEKLSSHWHMLSPLIALGGGVFGILGAAYTEFLHGSLLAAFVGAPIIEEMIKPGGVYLLLAKWPKALRNQIYTASLTAFAGIAFALIENLVYLNIYVDDPSPALVHWRYTACIGVHAVCSFIFGLGINQKLLASVMGETKLLSYGKRFFITAIVLHSIYNIIAVILENKLGFF